MTIERHVLEAAVRRHVAELFDVPLEAVRDDSLLAADFGADSLDLFELAMGLAEEFGLGDVAVEDVVVAAARLLPSAASVDITAPSEDVVGETMRQVRVATVVDILEQLT